MKPTFQNQSENIDLGIVTEKIKSGAVINQRELYEKSLAFIDKFKDANADPNLDLSALANEVNL